MGALRTTLALRSSLGQSRDRLLRVAAERGWLTKWNDDGSFRLSLPYGRGLVAVVSGVLAERHGATELALERLLEIESMVLLSGAGVVFSLIFLAFGAWFFTVGVSILMPAICFADIRVRRRLYDQATRGLTEAFAELRADTSFGPFR